MAFIGSHVHRYSSEDYILRARSIDVLSPLDYMQTYWRDTRGFEAFSDFPSKTPEEFIWTTLGDFTIGEQGMLKPCEIISVLMVQKQRFSSESAGHRYTFWRTIQEIEYLRVNVIDRPQSAIHKSFSSMSRPRVQGGIVSEDLGEDIEIWYWQAAIVLDCAIMPRLE